MLSDFLEKITDLEIRNILLEQKFDTVICYPGAGVDIYPCVLCESIDSEALEISRGTNRLYIFGDPMAYGQEWNSDMINYDSRISKVAPISHNVMPEEIIKWLIFSEGETAAWKKVDCLSCFKIVEIKEVCSCYYASVSVNQIDCYILIFPCRARKLWDIFTEYGISIDGVFIWNEQSWNFQAEVLEEIQIDMYPKWIIKNRIEKYSISEEYYEQNVCSEDQCNIILRCRNTALEKDGGIGIYRIKSSIGRSYARLSALTDSNGQEIYSTKEEVELGQRITPEIILADKRSDDERIISVIEEYVNRTKQDIVEEIAKDFDYPKYKHDYPKYEYRHFCPDPRCLEIVNIKLLREPHYSRIIAKGEISEAYVSGQGPNSEEEYSISDVYFKFYVDLGEEELIVVFERNDDGKIDFDSLFCDESGCSLDDDD